MRIIVAKITPLMRSNVSAVRHILTESAFVHSYRLLQFKKKLLLNSEI